MHVWSVRVLDRRREPANHRVAHVLGAELGVLLRRRRVPRDDRVTEAGLGERTGPILHPLFQVGPPLLGSRRIDVVHDRLDRIDQLTALERRRVRGLQAPARDVAPRDRLVVTEPEVHLLNPEEPDPLIPHAGLHRPLRQQDHGVVHLQRYGTGSGVRRRLLRRIRHHHPHLYVARIAPHPVDEGPVLVQRADLVAIADGARQAEDRHVRREQWSHVDHGCRRVGRGGAVARGRIDLERGDVESLDYGLEVGVAHGFVDGQRIVGDVRVRDDPQQDAILVPLPADGLRVVLLATVADVGGRARPARHQQHLALERLERDLVVQLVVDPVDDEQPGVGHRLVGDDFAVRLDLLPVVPRSSIVLRGGCGLGLSCGTRREAGGYQQRSGG